MPPPLMYQKREGAKRRHMRDPQAPVEKHRFVDYAGKHPFERLAKKERRYQHRRQERDREHELEDAASVPSVTTGKGSEESKFNMIKDFANNEKDGVENGAHEDTIDNRQQQQEVYDYHEPDKGSVFSEQIENENHEKIVRPVHYPFEYSSNDHYNYDDDDNPNDVFEPIRIHIDTTELESWGRSPSSSSGYIANNLVNQARIRYIMEQVLPKMKSVWTNALQVVPVSGNLKIDREWCPYGTSQSEVFNSGLENADLIVFVTANSHVCAKDVGWGVFASAFSCYWDQFNRPIGGNIDFCLNQIQLTQSDINALAATSSQKKEMNPNLKEFQRTINSVTGTAIHELAHILGMTSRDLVFFYDWKTGLPRSIPTVKQEVVCVTGERQAVFMPSTNTLRKVEERSRVTGKLMSLYYEVVTPTVRQVVRNQFNCQKLTGARLENHDTNADCFGSHFEERHFLTETMSTIQGEVMEVLSPLTLALLKDSGWYKPNFQVARISPFGHGAGCDFVGKPCIVNGEIPSYSKGFFCNTENKVKENGEFAGEYGCDPTHTHLAVCDLVDYSFYETANSPPPQYQYFQNSNLGSFNGVGDFCPTFTGEPIDCRDPSSSDSAALSKSVLMGESFGPESMCINTNSHRPVCLKGRCNEEKHLLEIIYKNSLYTCQYDRQTHYIPETGTSIECPLLAVVCPDFICPANCAGNGICDYSQENPKCECFDGDDDSLGCFKSHDLVPPKKSVQNIIHAKESMAQCSAWMSISVFYVSLLFALILLLG
eukprot:CAMPEP_0195522186 /NCGR_PEP_ID=MMETSP0794_2-20130614/20090_1 /TAXON_ID=515487 /ORGANISM="Stephanopyxis turris, Strain CCMP 815" /LENGTH=769 /DNA_ID=CAMNT_0040651879 /DNA_START=228 /DNA_END=2533 /DNA_ORIENTATION=+